MSKLDKSVSSVSRISMQIFIEGKFGHGRGRAGFNPYHMRRYTRGRCHGSIGNNSAWYITALTHGHIDLARLWPADGCALCPLWTWLHAGECFCFNIYGNMKISSWKNTLYQNPIFLLPYLHSYQNRAAQKQFVQLCFQ